MAAAAGVLVTKCPATKKDFSFSRKYKMLGRGLDRRRWRRHRGKNPFVFAIIKRRIQYE